MVTRALSPFHDGPDIAFVSNIGFRRIEDVLARSDPHRTGFIITSKSFNTAETYTRARARDWLTAAGVTWYTHVRCYRQPGKPGCRIYGHTYFANGYRCWWPLQPVVSGWPRHIMCHWQTILYRTCCAHNMDQHFFTTPLAKNLPVLMALHEFGTEIFLA